MGAGGGVADRAAGVRREPSAMFEQRGLAEAGGGFEHDDATSAGRVRSAREAHHRAGEHVELVNALDQGVLVGAAHEAPRSPMTRVRMVGKDITNRAILPSGSSPATDIQGRVRQR